MLWRQIRIKKRKRGGFTLIEMLIAVAIIAILIAIAIPAFSATLESSKKATCFANQRSLKAVVVTAWMASQTDMKETFNAEVGNYSCPSGGTLRLTVQKDEGSCTITCSEHDSSGVTAERAGLDGMRETVNAASPENWKDAVNALSGGDTSYQFPPVGEDVLDAYTAAKGASLDGVTLTWKPALASGDKSCVMIASGNGSDQTAISNAAAGQFGGYDPKAFIVYDGQDYYVPLHKYSNRPNPTWVSDDGIDIEGIRSGKPLGTNKVVWTKLKVD